MAEENLYPSVEEVKILEKECRLITRYLIEEEPSQEFISTYIMGNSSLLSDPQLEEDLSIMSFIRQYAWVLPFMDAACGILRPRSLLRKKILLMVAILEASPHYINHFLPEAVSGPRFFFSMLRYGVQAGVKVILGFCIYPMAIRVR